jgi:catechol 2,3-dioxygenase-like lactoylglutathione lyase family enzyme
MIGTVYHTGYLTDDVERAVDFYRQTFGARVDREMAGATGDRMVFVKFGESEVELIQPAD